MNNLKNQVEYCLATYPEARDSDITLMILLWKEYYPQRLIDTISGQDSIMLESLYDLPREDNIKRYRAKFQNDKKNPQYLPTDPEVARQRGIKEEVMREEMGHSPSTFERI